MKKHSTTQILVVFTVLVLILISFHLVVFMFIRNSGTTVATLKRDVDVLNAQVIEFSKYSAEDMRRLADSVTERFVSNEGLVGFIENIEREARSRGLIIAIRSVVAEPRSDDPTDDKEIVRLQLEVRGPWRESMRFLNFLEHLPYKTSFSTVAFSLIPEEEAGSAILWRSQMEMTVLKLK